jgi:basic membrane protein A
MARPSRNNCLKLSRDKTVKRILAFAVAALSVAGTAAAQFQPAVIFDMGGKFDKSFNESAYNGAERFKAETGIEYLEFEVTDPSQREGALRQMAELGANPIVVMGFAQADAMAVVSAEFPDTNFGIVDVGWLGGDNIRQYVYKEHEGSFLVGALAAMASETGVVSFVGGMEIPLIARFACGYKQGVHAVNPDIEVIVQYTGTTPAAWNDPTKGAEITRSQFDRGADVVFAAAGGTGVGVYQAAADAGKLAIGVDSNQNYLHPGTMLSSMVKRVDNAVYDTFMASMNDEFVGGVFSLGLAEEGVGAAMDEYNADLVSADMMASVADFEAAIIGGSIAVGDQMMDEGACPNL